MSEVLKRRMRCAVYTRKSTDEGLDQEYNSIDAQRDAGHAYIASQRAEGSNLVGQKRSCPDIACNFFFAPIGGVVAVTEKFHVPKFMKKDIGGRQTD